ncbi:CrcB family protein [Nocardiopsis sp. CT-R113]|uniref:Fluoride-specific ion channel FluC n=1 Tax=Nocardiopsis codii TaxID=3065942 RepID=A0ABU7K457_9ACTN|nr:CrcB family protein [Nocardiopsis sp. CT-R113]MEE2037031.1 CrcB family protein [Nocardiopsis sp. CT-R113]
MTALLVVLGAAVGAPARFLVDLAVQSRHDTPFPWGTLCVNLTGCLILGALSALPLPREAMALLGAGLCGALTTYSTFAYEAYRLAATGERLYAGLYVAVSLTAGLGAAWVGIALTRVLLG